MVAKKIEFSVQKRETVGTDNVRRLRKTGMVPGVIYGGGKGADMVQLNEHDFKMLLRRHASQFLMIDLSVDDAAPRTVLLKEVQHHPLTSHLLHVDFHEVAMDQKVKVEIVINLVGTPVGVSQGGGTADFLLRTLQVECLPGDMIESLDLDISDLDVGDTIVVGEIEDLDAEKYGILTSADVTVVSIAKPRVAEEEEAAEAGEDVDGDAEDSEGEGEAEGDGDDS